MEVLVSNRQRARRVGTAVLRRFLCRVAREIGPGAAGDVGLRLVSDRAMRAYNRTYRGVDRPTDVLSFPAGPEDAGSRYLGDLVISVETAARQARERGHSLGRELATLALHGYLHLMGHDHETDDGEMLRLQRRLERRLLPRPGAGGASR